MRFQFPTKKIGVGVIATLRKVRKLLTPAKNWIKGRYRDEPEGRYCLIGAVQKVNGPVQHYTEAFLQAFNKAQGRRKAVEGFNDSQRTKHADILAFLDDAVEAGIALKAKV